MNYLKFEKMSFRKKVQSCPQSTVVLDRFHIIKLFDDKLTNLRFGWTDRFFLDRIRGIRGIESGDGFLYPFHPSYPV